MSLRKRISRAASVSMCALLIGASSVAMPSVIPGVGITANAASSSFSLDKTSATVTKGNKVTLVATSTTTSSNKSVNWSTSNNRVANVTSVSTSTTGGSSVTTVTVKGKTQTTTVDNIKTVSTVQVSTYTAGTATITAKNGDGKTVSCKITVTDSGSVSVVPVSSILLGNYSLTMTAGESKTLNATIWPSNATNKTITWSTSNGNVAAVSGGKITAKAAGSATITAKSNNGKTASCYVTVKGGSSVAVTGISLNKTSLSIQKGQTQTITATVSPSNATNKTITWTTSNGNVATVSGGKITAKAAGTATITAKTNNGKTASCKVTATNTAVAATGVSLNKTSLSIQKGQSQTITATVSPSNATNKSVAWSTSNSNIATVSGGKITAKAVGSATITAKTNNGKTASCKVTVTNESVAVTGISLNKTSLTIQNGQTQTITATVSPSNATNKAVTWSTSNGNVASVSGGKITAKAVGTATITAKTNNGKTATCKVTVKSPKASSFRWGVDNWRFTNSPNNFGSTYYINSTYYNKLVSGLNRLEKNNIDRGLRASWGGSCYGMAVTSILGNWGILDPSKYASGAKSVNDINAPLTNDVKSLINYYFAVQYTDQIGQKTNKALYEKESVKINRLLDCLKDNSPTLLTYFWPPQYNPLTGSYAYSGHAVVGCGVQNVSGTTSNGFSYNKKVLIYDNRCKGLEDSRCLYINSSNDKWCIPADGLYSGNGATLGLITDSIDDINYHGYISGNNHINIGDFISVLSTTNVNSEITWSKFTNEDSMISYNSVDDDEIKMFSALTDSTSSGRFNVGFKNSNVGYSMKIEKPQNQSISMRYENCLIDIDTSKTDRISFSPDGFAQIDGNNTDYTIKVTYNDGYYYKDWYEVSVSGKGTDKAVFKPTSEGYVLESSNLRNIIINAKNDDSSPSRIFSTDCSKALIYEINEATIGVKVDADNNGTFETELKTDINPTSIKLNKTSSTLGKGETITLKAEVSPSNTTNKTVTWTSSNTNVATVSNGKITAKNNGTATITAKTSNGKTATCKITVKNAPTKITLTKGVLTLGVGEKFTVGAGINDGAGCATRTYRTSNSSVVKMTRTDWNGDFYGVKPGIAYVTVRTYNGKESTCKVTVKAAPTSVTISKKTLTLKVGQSASLSCSVPSNAGCAARTYRTNNSSVLQMTKTNWTGSFKALKPGTAYVTVKTYNGKESSCKVTVTK